MALTIAEDFIVHGAREVRSMKFGSKPRGGAGAETLDRSVPRSIARDVAMKMLLLSIEKMPVQNWEVAQNVKGNNQS